MADLNVRADQMIAAEFNYQWLGQAGFLIGLCGIHIVIDPYLSDSLAEKYKNSRFTHERMMPPPVQPQQLCDIDWVLCTHQHTDHMDAQTLLPIHDFNSNCQFLVPRAWENKALEMGISRQRLHSIDCNESLQLNDDVRVNAVLSAHEVVTMTNEGHSWFLGYVIESEGTTMYHSGDCIPFEGLLERLGQFDIDIAFLPVNGRDSFRQRHGIPGNFTIDEAVELCVKAKIPVLVCHHFDLFAFNTVDRRDLEIAKERHKGNISLVIPDSLARNTMHKSSSNGLNRL